MSDYSIELASRRIVDKRSAKHFEEVHQCYVNNCFRAATVMLWTAVVCDLYYKIDELANVYGDTVAQDILTKIKQKQAANAKSPEWELMLLEEIANRTELLTTADFASLSTLQQHRHLSAHPVLNSLDFLYEPSQDTVRSHLRVALDAVLSKPSLMTRRVFDALTEDIEVNGPKIVDEVAFAKYIKSKYVGRLGNAAYLQVFRSLWRQCFRSLDARTEACRTQLLRVLLVMIQHDTQRVVEAIHGDPTFGDINLAASIQKVLFDFLRRYPQVFGQLKDETQTLLRGAAEGDHSVFTVAPFISPSLVAHIDLVRERVTAGTGNLATESFLVLNELAETAEEHNSINKLAVEAYGRSTNFDDADRLFDEVVAPVLNSFEESEQVRFLQVHRANYQCRMRNAEQRAMRQFEASLGDKVEEIKAKAAPPAQAEEEE